MSQPVQTEDLSYTLFSESYGEHYHSTFGARTESMHVFIEAGLRHSQFAIRNSQFSIRNSESAIRDSVSILEIGFGTGLNAWLTALEAEQTLTPILYEGIELFPITPEQARALSEDALFLALHEAPWEQTTAITPHFSLLKRQTNLLECPFNGTYDIVFFDAFSPNVQPELWQEDIFSRLFASMNPGGILTTYCAKGEVRRTLQRVGFTTERIPGPKGKREMLRATKG